MILSNIQSRLILLAFILSILCFEITLGGQKFLRQPNNVTVVEGDESLRLRCAFIDLEVAPTDVQWLKDNFGLGIGPELKQWPRYSITGSSSYDEFNLYITDVQLSDEGEYNCQASPNAQGKNRLKSRNAYVTVYVPPKKITINPLDEENKISVLNGEEVRISCTSSASKPPAKVSIMIGDRTVEGKSSITIDKKDFRLTTTTTSYVFRPTILHNNKQVTCVVSNAAISSPATSASKLNILYAPEAPILVGIGNGPLFSEDVFVAKCSSRGGNPFPDISWTIGDQVISSHHQTNGDNITESVLRHNLRPQDDGKFVTCKVSNSAMDYNMETKRVLNVYYWPTTVTVSQQPEGVSENELLRFKCQSSKSNPQAVLTWYKEDKILEESDLSSDYEIMTSHDNTAVTSVLTLHNVAKSDRDVTYYCKVTLTEFSTVKSLPINPVIYVAPDFLNLVYSHATHVTEMLDGSENIRAFKTGSKLYVKCNAQGGFPRPKISWYMDDEKVTALDAGVIITNTIDGDVSSSMIELTLTSQQNGALLSCATSNTEYVANLHSRAMKVMVMFGPDNVAIEQWPLVAMENQQLAITCHSSSSFPAPVLTWYKNNAPLSTNASTVLEPVMGSNKGYVSKSQLNIKLVQKDDNSVIECRASNEVANTPVTSSLQLDILYKPKFERKYLKLSGLVGQLFVVDIPYIANPDTVNYKWFKYIPINVECSDNLLTTFKSSKYIEEGLFNFEDFPDVIPTLRKCPVLGDKKVLDFSILERSDRGIYELEIENSAGKNNVIFSVDVLYSPIVESLTGPNKPIKEWENVVLKCNVIYHPKSNVTVNWMHKTMNGYVKVLEERLQKPSYSLLRLPNITSADRGNYRCYATGDNGQSNTKEYTLKMLFAPIFVKAESPRKVVVQRSSVTSLQCTAIASPAVTFIWFKDQKKIDFEQTNGRISMESYYDGEETYKSIVHIKEDDNLVLTEFICVAKNSEGQMHYTIQVVNKGPPDAPDNLVALNVTNDTFTVGWRPQFNGGATQTFLVQYLALNDDATSKPTLVKSISVPTNTHQLTISKLHPRTTYTVHVIAVNQYGKSARSKTLRIQTHDTDAPKTGLVWNLTKVSSNYALILGCLIGIFVLCLVVIAFCVIYRRSNRRSKFGAKYLQSDNSSRSGSDPGCSISARASTRNSVASTANSDIFKGANSNSAFRQSKRSIRSLPESHNIKICNNNESRRNSFDNTWESRLSTLSSLTNKSEGIRLNTFTPTEQKGVRYCVRENTLYSSLPTTDDYDVANMRPPSLPKDFYCVSEEPLSELNSNHLERQYHTLLSHERPLTKINPRGRCSYVSPPTIPEEYTDRFRTNRDYSINVDRIRSTSLGESSHHETVPLFVQGMSNQQYPNRRKTSIDHSNDSHSTTSSFSNKSQDTKLSFLTHSDVAVRNTMPNIIGMIPADFKDNVPRVSAGKRTEDDKDSGCGDSSGVDGMSPTDNDEINLTWNYGTGQFHFQKDDGQVALFV